jgi:hypothetical protein
MTTIYSVGTATVLGGGTTVTGIGTSWAGKVFEGDLYTDPAQGLFARITADATDNTSLTINAWPGTDMTGDAYEVLLQQDSIRMSERMRQYVELAGAIANTGIGIDAFGVLADRTSYDDSPTDFAFLSLDGDGASIATAVVFIKASSDAADWSDAILVQGNKGDQGEPGLGVWEGAWITATAYAVDDIVEYQGSSYICVVAHTSGAFATDLAAVKWELVVEKGDVGIEQRGTYSGATAYVKGDIALYNGSTWIALQATTGNAPPTLPTTSNTYWQLLARQGIDGAGTVSSVVEGPGIAVDNTDPTAPVVSESIGARIESSLLALQVADNSNAALFLGNSVADAFDALTYVDVAWSTNLNSATTGVLKPTIAADTYAASLDYPTGSWTNFADFNNYMARQRFPAAALTDNGDTFRLVITPPSTGSNFVLEEMWFGDAGAGSAFAGNQVQVTFNGGATGVTIVAGSAPFTTDIIAFSFDKTVDKMAAMDFGATSAARGLSGPSGYVSYQKAATSGEASHLAPTGYTTTSDLLIAVNKIEVRTAAGTPNNMAVRSTSFTAPIIPDTLSAILLVKEVGGSSVAGTDYTFKCSRDGGTTLDTMTLTEKFDLQTGFTVIEAAALDVTGQPSANNPRWRFDTLNNKNVELHGVHFLWPTGSSP